MQTVCQFNKFLYVDSIQVQDSFKYSNGCFCILIFFHSSSVFIPTCYAFDFSDLYSSPVVPVLFVASTVPSIKVGR